MSLNDECVSKMLEIQKNDNERIILNSKDEIDWYDYVIQN